MLQHNSLPVMLKNEPRLTALDRAIVAVALVLPTAITWVYFVGLNGADKALQQAAYAVGKTIQFALPLVWVWLVQRQRSWPKAPSIGNAVIGIVFGLTVAAAMYAIYS